MDKIGFFLIVFLGVLSEAFGRPQYNNNMVCIPGMNFKQACNSCTCTDNGLQYICTMRACTLFENEIRDDEVPSYAIRKREVETGRQKRDISEQYYNEDPQFFMDDDQIPQEQIEDLAQQRYLQQQQDYYDQQQLQADLAQQEAELKAQNEEMQKQLKYQQEEDRKQLERDSEEEKRNRLQELFDQYQQQQFDQYPQQVYQKPNKNNPYGIY